MNIMDLAKERARDADKLATAYLRLREAVQIFIDIGKRDLSNPKYDGYFTELRECLKETQ